MGLILKQSPNVQKNSELQKKGRYFANNSSLFLAQIYQMYTREFK